MKKLNVILVFVAIAIMATLIMLAFYQFYLYLSPLSRWLIAILLLCLAWLAAFGKNGVDDD
jgi:hypothetical protein